MNNKYEVNGDITTIFVEYKGRTLETIIDTCDLPLVKSQNVTWRAHFSGAKRDKFYIFATVYTKRIGDTPAHSTVISMSRLLMGFPPGLVVDHKNDDSLNNRRSCNLQSITNGENVRKQIKMRGKGVYRTVPRMAKSRGIGHFYEV